MENKQSKKDNGTRTIFIFVTFILLFFLIFLIAKTGLDSKESIGLAFAFVFLIITGLWKIFKQQPIPKGEQENHYQSQTQGPVSSSDDEQIPITNNPTMNPSQASGPTTSTSENHFVGSSSVNFLQKINNWLSKFPKPKQVMIVAGSLIIVIVIVIISITSFTGEADTTITGTWSHELGSVQYESTWVVNVTMWEVGWYNESGYLYMYLSDDGTFTLTYNDVMVSYGTWEVHNSGYVFVFNDPDAGLGSVSDYYDLKGSKLYMNVNAYWVKEEPDA